MVCVGVGWEWGYVCAYKSGHVHRHSGITVYLGVAGIYLGVAGRRVGTPAGVGVQGWRCLWTEEPLKCLKSGRDRVMLERHGK